MYKVIDIDNGNKLLLVPKKEVHKWRFYYSSTNRQKGVQVELTDLGEELVLECDKTVLVYHIPSANDYHFEVLRHTRLAHFLSKPVNYNPETDDSKVVEVRPDFDALLENMVEFREKIVPAK